MLPKEHLNPAPADAPERADPVQKEEQGAIAMENVVIAERIESSTLLEARRQSAERVGLLDDGHVLPTGSGERVCRSDAGETPTDDHRRGPSRSAASD